MKRTQTVLIVTDAEDIHSGIGWLLQRRGYKAIEVCSRAAIEHVRDETPGLVLIDSDHPLTESLALAQSLREQSDLAETEIVIVTYENQISSQVKREGNEYLIDRNDSASILNLVSNLDSARERPLRRAHGA